MGVNTCLRGCGCSTFPHARAHSLASPCQGKARHVNIHLDAGHAGQTYPGTKVSHNCTSTIPCCLAGEGRGTLRKPCNRNRLFRGGGLQDMMLPHLPAPMPLKLQTHTHTHTHHITPWNNNQYHTALGWGLPKVPATNPQLRWRLPKVPVPHATGKCPSCWSFSRFFCEVFWVCVFLPMVYHFFSFIEQNYCFVLQNLKLRVECVLSLQCYSVFSVVGFLFST